ncbi:SPFH domain-containing protein [Rubinisphaera margarita]|uniref:SPFH domain-containing protein n=1 Tax=Rubinisphaera margarita TaxID=2909586 RepID=UPI001EE7D2DD|nr:SPFH domain-containing protein [Rubinisphaera margarita]MCG6156671.1 hypothetical protein [Rubinisphaera margarita]
MSSSGVMTFFGFYVIRQDEIGVRLTLGQFSGIVRPGLGFAIPFFQQITKTRRSLQTIDLPEQQIVLNGNISVRISGNLNFRVDDPEKALLDVSNYRYTIQQLALTTIADVLGTKTIEEVRNEKIKIAQEIEAIVARNAKEWGLRDLDIRLTDAQLDHSLQRAMMRETEAQKEANAIKIKAESDKFVSQIFADAAKTLGSSPGAMTLRVLQTLSDVSNDKTTVVMPIPIELLTMFQNQRSEGDRAPRGDSTGVQTGPMGELRMSGGKAVATCPGCGAKYDVTEIAGNPDFDVDPEVPGQQLRCRKCSIEFSLPQEMPAAE